MTSEKAIEILARKTTIPDEGETFDEICEAFDMAISVLSKRGEWLKIYPEHEEWNIYECSRCGEEFNLIEGTPYDNGYNFCPNCGADMRGRK